MKKPHECKMTIRPLWYDHENGYICAGEEGVTSAPGVFAAGDIRTKALRQIVTAVSDGANAVASAQKYLWRKDNGND